jgi:hypothetical protein
MCGVLLDYGNKRMFIFTYDIFKSNNGTGIPDIPVLVIYLVLSNPSDIIKCCHNVENGPRSKK